MGYCTINRDGDIITDVKINSSDIEDNVVKTIYSDGKNLHVIDNHNCDIWIDTTSGIEDSLKENFGIILLQTLMISIIHKKKRNKLSKKVQYDYRRLR